MNYIKQLLMMSLMVISQGSLAFIYEVKVMRKWDSERKRYHYFIGCSDFHDKTHPSNSEQLKFIEQILNKADKSLLRILLEDLSSQNNTGQFACGRFFVNSRGGILGGLAEKCRAIGLDINNVEFRYCRVTSLGPVLNNLQEDMEKFASVRMTKVALLNKEIADAIEEVRAYTDGPILKKFYDANIQDAVTHIKALHLDQHKDLSIAQYLKTHSTLKNRLDLLKKLLTFDSGLLDLRMIHAVVNGLEKGKVVALAGGAHISRVCDLLEKVGYQSIQSTKVSFTQERDLQRCLGSHIIDGAYCVKPEPINIDFLSSLILNK